MPTIVAVLVLFLGLGLFTHKYNGWTRLLLIGIIVAMIVYIYRT